VVTDELMEGVDVPTGTMHLKGEVPTPAIEVRSPSLSDRRDENEFPT